MNWRMLFSHRLAPLTTACGLSVFLLVVAALVVAPPWSASPKAVAAEAVAAQLAAVRVVTARPTIVGYQREYFGGWSGPSQCTTRDEVLAQWFEGSQCQPNPSFTAVDPYTGGAITAAEVDIDHVYPLAAAWDLGAYQWSASRRRAFGNDTELNLLPTLAAVNRDKGDSTPAEWLPTAEMRCPYAHRYLAVALKWELPVSEADWLALAGSCGLDVD